MNHAFENGLMAQFEDTNAWYDYVQWMESSPPEAKFLKFSDKAAISCILKAKKRKSSVIKYTGPNPQLPKTQLQKPLVLGSGLGFHFSFGLGSGLGRPLGYPRF